MPSRFYLILRSGHRPRLEGRMVVLQSALLSIVEERCPVVSPRPLLRRIRLEVKLPRLARRAATVPERGDMDGADDAALRQRDDVADAHRMTRLRPLILIQC